MDSSDQVIQGLGDKLESIDFHHPFTPYNVQLDFMRTVYQVLQTGSGQIGILESPTGTGKSLSLICASLTWLRHYKASNFEDTLTSASKNFTDEPSWLVDQLLKRQKEELLERWKEREKRLEAVRQKEKALEEKGRVPKRRRVDIAQSSSGSSLSKDDEEAEWLLDETEDANGSNDQDPLSGLSKASRDVLASIGLGGPRKKEEDATVLEESVKVRTVPFDASSSRRNQDSDYFFFNRFIILREPILNCHNSSLNYAVQAFRLPCQHHWPNPKRQKALNSCLCLQDRSFA